MWARSKRHLAAAGETYSEHFRFAMTVAVLTIAAGLACLIHALVPGLCTRTCSTIITRLNHLFAERDALAQVRRQSSGALTFVGLLALGAAMTFVLAMGGAGFAGGLLVGSLAFAIPLTFLLSNPELDEVAAGQPA